MRLDETSKIKHHQLDNDVMAEQTGQHVRLLLPGAYDVLSSAVLHGGFTKAAHIINLKVAKNLGHGSYADSPEKCLAAYAAQIGIKESTVGMMTAASMDSLSVAKKLIGNDVLAVLVTSGLSNPRRAGDKADYPYFSNEPPAPGTINTIIYSSLALTRAAMVEAVMIATEAKVSVLQDFEVRSPISNGLATGTGTDSLALVCAPGGTPLKYAGKHVLFGEVLARLMIEALSASIRWEFSEQLKKK